MLEYELAQTLGVPVNPEKKPDLVSVTGFSSHYDPANNIGLINQTLLNNFQGNTGTLYTTEQDPKSPMSQDRSPRTQGSPTNQNGSLCYMMQSTIE